MLAGKTISHYKILERLGGGGMGVVYRAEDIRLKRIVALKFLSPDLTSHEESRARFILEAQAASALDHPNICAIHELGITEEGQIFIAMSCYEGQTLQEKLTDGPLGIELSVSVTMQLASALAQAHRVGILHRDIKPGNVIITSDGIPKIIDFGLAKLVGQARLTRTASAAGTPFYMSPEQVRGEEVDARTDIWSTGVVLYEMLTGKSPFSAEHEQAVLYKILNLDPEPPETYRPKIPSMLVKILERALQKDPIDRYSSALEMVDDLRRTRENTETVQTTARAVASVAVLPFEDMSPEHDQEYFCDGVAEELINALTHVTGLRVISRTSSFSFKGRKADVREIGRKLGVDTLLEGSVRKAGPHLRISAQLINVADESPLWSERYDRDLQDIFAIQDDVCISVVDQLKVILGQGERTNLIRRRAGNPDAYNLYLMGRFHFNQRKREGVAKSIKCYAQALAIDPSFALAYAGMAESYEILGSWREIPREIAYREARKASQAALRLEDLLPEAHIVAGYVSLFCDWDWSVAERELQRALTLNPASAEGHHIRAHYLEMMGKCDLAVAEIKRALELEPVAPSLHACCVQILFNARRFEEAIRQGYATFEMAPGFFGLYGWIGAAHLKNGNHDSALAALNEGLSHLPEDPRLHALFGTVCAYSNNLEEANATVALLSAISKKKYLDPYYMVWLFAAMGKSAEACDFFDRAYEEHSNWAPWAGIDPLLDDLRSEPRFTAVLQRMDLKR